MPYKTVEELASLGMAGGVHPYAELFGVAHKLPVYPRFFVPETGGLSRPYFKALVNFTKDEVAALDAFCYEIADWYWKQIKLTSREEAIAMGFSANYADLYNKYMQVIRAGQRFRKETVEVRRRMGFAQKAEKTTNLRARKYREAAARFAAMGNHAQAQLLIKKAEGEEGKVAKSEKQRAVAREYLGYKQKAVAKEVAKIPIEAPIPVAPIAPPIYYAPPEVEVAREVVEVAERDDEKPSVAPLMAAGVGGAILMLLFL